MGSKGIRILSGVVGLGAAGAAILLVGYLLDSVLMGFLVGIGSALIVVMAMLVQYGARRPRPGDLHSRARSVGMAIGLAIGDAWDRPQRGDT